ncbi:MAG: hypothetical protein WBA57_10850 [Elainellaceae cyanobacterium]
MESREILLTQNIGDRFQSQSLECDRGLVRIGDRTHSQSPACDRCLLKIGDRPRS